MSAVHQDMGEDDFKSKFPYHWLKASWYHYLSILDIDYDNGYNCPRCSLGGNTPSIIICDGTSLAFRREFLCEIASFEVQPQSILLDGR